MIMRALLVVAALCGAAARDIAPARAQAIDETTTYGDLSGDQKLRVIDLAIRQGRYELAGAFLTETRFEDEAARETALFLAARLLKATGQVKGAAATYRRLLASNPDLDLVRAELAHSLYLLGEDEAARHHFSLLLAAAPEESAADTFRNFIDSIDARQPFQTQFVVSLAPGTNVNSGTDASSVSLGGLPFRIDAASRRKSGVGLRLGADAAYTWRFGAVEPYLGAGFLSIDYPHDEFDDLTVSGRGGLRYRLKDGFVGAEGVVSRRFFATSPYSLTAGPRVYAAHRIGPRLRAYGSASAKQRQFDQSPDAEGWTYELDGRLTVALAPGLQVTPLVSVVREEAPDRPFIAYDELELGASVYYEAPFGITVRGLASHAWRDYGGAFPGRTTARHDRRLTLSLSLLKRDWDIAGWTPQIGYARTENESDVVFYDYARDDFQVTLTRRF